MCLMAKTQITEISLRGHACAFVSSCVHIMLWASLAYAELCSLQGVSTSRTGASESESDVRYPTLHKPGQSTTKTAPSAAAESESDVRYPTLHKPGQHATKGGSAAPDSAEAQYPGIYKPNKKKIDSSTVGICLRHHLLLPHIQIS